MGNDAVLSIIHEARMRFLSSHGYTEMNVEGISLIMTDVAISFKAEAFYGDILKVSVCASDFSRVGFDLVYKLEKETGNTIEIVAVAKTGMVSFDYTSKRVTGLPETVPLKLSCPR